MIAVLFANDSNSINYHIDSGLFISLFGCFTAYVVYKVDLFIYNLKIKYTNSIFLIKFSISFFISAFILIFISWLFNILIRGEWALKFVFIKQQMILLNFLLIIILSSLTISYFTKSITIRNQKLKAENIKMNEALNKYLTRIPSLSNKKTTLIPVSDIIYFKIEDGIIFAQTDIRNKYPISISTLNILESKLNPAGFFRINRSEIVNINAVVSYEPYLKDRLVLNITNLNIKLYTSNAKSTSFKEWLINATN
jgi:hypothetical protein